MSCLTINKIIFTREDNHFRRLPTRMRPHRAKLCSYANSIVLIPRLFSQFTSSIFSEEFCFSQINIQTQKKTVTVRPDRSIRQDE